MAASAAVRSCRNWLAQPGQVRVVQSKSREVLHHPQCLGPAIGSRIDDAQRRRPVGQSRPGSIPFQFQRARTLAVQVVDFPLKRLGVAGPLR